MRDRRTERRSDMTALRVYSSNCITKAPKVGMCFRLEKKLRTANFCSPLWHSWLPHTCPIFGLYLLDLPYKTRKILSISIFWYITDGRLCVESCDPELSQSIRTVRILVSGADVLFTHGEMFIPMGREGWN